MSNPQTSMPPVPKEPIIDSRGQMSNQWQRWISQLQRVLSFSGGIAWGIVDKAGSSLSDIVTRPHSMLQSILGWSSTTDDVQNRHISDANGKVWQDHVEVVDGNPHGTDHAMLDNVLQSDDTSINTDGGKHVTDAQLKVYKDHTELTGSNHHGVDHGATYAPIAGAVPVGGTTDQVLAKNSNTDRDLKWVTNTGGGGGISDAPSDGKIYVRRNAAWEELVIS